MDISKMVELKRIRKAANQEKAEKKRQEIYQKYPELKDLEAKINNLNLERTLLVITPLSGEGAAESETKVIQQIEQLEAEKKRFFKEKGIKPKDLLPTYDCKKCNDDGFVENTMCSCLKKLRAKALKEEYALSGLLSNQNFKHFDLSIFSADKNISKNSHATQRDIIALHKERAEEFVKSFPNQKSLIFTGDTGLGKTFLCNCIASDLLDTGYLVSYYSHTALNTLFKENLSFNKSAEIATQYADLFDVDLLIIDDLLEQATDTAVSELLGLIDRRLTSGKSTIITTNLNMEQIEEVFGSRIKSRLSTYIKFSFYGDDVREHKTT